MKRGVGAFRVGFRRRGGSGALGPSFSFRWYRLNKKCNVFFFPRWLLVIPLPSASRTVLLPLLERVGVESVANDAGDVEYVVHKPIDV